MQVFRGVPYVVVTRGDLVESIHDVVACVADAAGEIVRAVGDVEVPIYLRSAAKPLIAACIVASGAADAFELDAREIALVAASHNGETEHAATAAAILAKLGLDERALRCGAQVPGYEPAAAALVRAGAHPSTLHNNCSGKHAGILALCAHRGYDMENYLALDHPAQREILAFCARITGDDPLRFPVAIDGCGIPVFATSMRRAARAFARLGSPAGVADDDAAALAVVRDAIAREPFYVGGTDRLDSTLPVATQGRIVGKAGAEGVHGDALGELGLGLALKVVDGAKRAIAPAAIGLMNELGALDPAAQTMLGSFTEPEITNVAGRVVGRITTRYGDTIGATVTS